MARPNNPYPDRSARVDARLAERERILVSDADRERFFHALEHPQPPAPALVEAWRSLRARTGSA
jgi:uncharacterized protein (DUF1778 family)